MTTHRRHRKGGKPEAAPATPDDDRKLPNPDHTKLTSVTTRAQRNDTEPNEKFNTIRKDVVNLLLPETDYNNQKSGVGAILQIMAGKRKKGKRRNVRTESCRISPLKETNVLQRSNSDRKPSDVPVPTQVKNTPDDADFVKALVLQKYSKNNDNKEHVSLVYVNDPDLDEKKHAEALLREIARTIDCTVDKLNENKQMGGTDSKIVNSEPLYESIDERNLNYRNELKDELNKLLEADNENKENGNAEIGDRSEVTDKCESSESESENEGEVSGSETEEEIIEEIIEEISVCEPFEVDNGTNADETKTLVSQDSKYQSQVASLTELEDTRCSEAERTRELIAAYRKEIEEKEQEIQQLKCELAAAYKESELVRQRSRSLEEELTAARTCSSNLADQLHRRNDESLRQIRAELEDVLGQRAELESRVLALERDKERLEQEKILQEQKAQEQRKLARQNGARPTKRRGRRRLREPSGCWQTATTVEELKSDPKPSPAQVAELQQLRGLVTEQQRSVQSLTLQLQRVETREEALKLEVHRLKELLERETSSGKEKDERYRKDIQNLKEEHSKSMESLRSEMQSAAASSRAALERNHAERTRAALAQLRAEAQQDAKNADRKLREVTARLESLKEVLANKETQYERAIAEAHSKADWDIMQLRHMLDKADITYANKIEEMSEKFEKEKESLIEEWSEKLREVEEQAATAADEAKNLLESTRLKLIAERMEQVNKLKEQHRQEMVKAAACGRTLAVTEQELREALAREKELREKRSEDATKIKQVENASREQIEHLTRKCACLRKLFDDIRAKLTARERAAEQESKAKDKELHQLRGEVARLTKILFEQNTPKLGARTRADGCETAPPEETPAEPRRKGGTLRTPEAVRKNSMLPDFSRARLTPVELQGGRPRAKSVDLPAVQVPVRIKQLEERNKD
ncbi:hypothetical protein HW555_006088 [Spodoptera exigua]|uniref:Uncharacterized protein n=1 Tax=Spodoptera exigua TaxID=7107 RepID=A0A835GJD8_SPOEX|nr:hypothetical protein HW555_006088 [Spodoptera exigua]